MNLLLNLRRFALIGAASLLPMALAGAAAAQQDRAGSDEPDVVIVFPTGDRTTGSLLVEFAGPAEVPVGRSFEYAIKATNITRNLVLEDVTIHQTKADGFSIESAEPKQEQADDGSARWTIGKLKPGESKLIKATAQSDKEGMAAGCIRADFHAALCLTTRFVKPDLKVAKQAPEQADLCDTLTYRYTVENTGSGVARGVVLRDELPEGLTAVQGGKAVEFQVGDLQPGQSRQFSAELQAADTGDFSSRAVAKGQNDLIARSNKPTTAVRRAELAVSINGPSSMYVNQPMTYRVEVTNQGEVAARAARLAVEADEMARLVRTSKSDPLDVAPDISGNNLSWDLGTIQPGQTVAVSMTLVGRSEAELKHTAVATSACERGGDIAEAGTATQTVQTQILTFPALLLQLVDRNDPVQVGQKEVYRVTVVNQGSGADENVTVTCTLPEQFRFISAQGTGEAKADGQTVTLGPIDRLSPNERAVWDLQVEAVKPGDVRTRAELTSEYLSDGQPGLSVEPTRVIASVSSDPDQGDGRDGQPSDDKSSGK